MTERDILNIEQAAELLGVSVKTFNKVLHHENMPARKIGREWKFSRQALIDWVGNGRSQDFYKDADARDEESSDVEITPYDQNGARAHGRAVHESNPEKPRARRTAGWQIED